MSGESQEKPAGFWGRLFGRGGEEDRAVVAKVGTENKMYYNKDLKRWVIPGEEDQMAAEQTLAPPPMSTKTDASASSTAPRNRMNVRSRYVDVLNADSKAPAVPTGAAPPMFGGPFANMPKGPGQFKTFTPIAPPEVKDDTEVDNSSSPRKDSSSRSGSAPPTSPSNRSPKLRATMFEGTPSESPKASNGTSNGTCSSPQHPISPKVTSPVVHPPPFVPFVPPMARKLTIEIPDPEDSAPPVPNDDTELKENEQSQAISSTVPAIVYPDIPELSENTSEPWQPPQIRPVSQVSTEPTWEPPNIKEASTEAQSPEQNESPTSAGGTEEPSLSVSPPLTAVTNACASGQSPTSRQQNQDDEIKQLQKQLEVERSTRIQADNRYHDLEKKYEESIRRRDNDIEEVQKKLSQARCEIEDLKIKQVQKTTMSDLDPVEIVSRSIDSMRQESNVDHERNCRQLEVEAYFPECREQIINSGGIQHVADALHHCRGLALSVLWNLSYNSKAVEIMADLNVTNFCRDALRDTCDKQAKYACGILAGIALSRPNLAAKFIPDVQLALQVFPDSVDLHISGKQFLQFVQANTSE